jgi:hypothetical protein
MSTTIIIINSTAHVVRRLLVAANVVPSSPILVTLITETSAITRATRRQTPEEGILHNHRRENLKSYIVFLYWEASHRHIRRLETLWPMRTKTLG